MSFGEVKNYFEDRKIHCIKLNHSLDSETQNFASFNAFFELTENFTEFELYNLKPQQVNGKVVEQLVKDGKLCTPAQCSEHGVFRMDADLLQDPNLFTKQKSTTSCRLSDIQGFIYGGFNSRFWMLRKYLIQKPNEAKHSRLKSWNCITLQLRHRDIDLIILDDYQTKMFLKFLIFELKTLNGQRDSGKKLLDLLQDQEIKNYKKLSGEYKISTKIQY